jgi:hypothetical protein
MARGDKDNILNGFHGRLNDCIVIKQRNGKPVMCFYPKGKKVNWTENQDKNRQSFKRAARYARHAIRDPERLAFYRSREHDGVNAYNLAISDYSKKPVITSIGIRKARSRDAYLVRVRATDEFMVTRVELRLYDLAGQHKIANAIRYRKSNLWTCRVDGEQLGTIRSIRAFAYDYPGNHAEMDYIISPEESIMRIPHR